MPQPPPTQQQLVATGDHRMPQVAPTPADTAAARCHRARGAWTVRAPLPAPRYGAAGIALLDGGGGEDGRGGGNRGGGGGGSGGGGARRPLVLVVAGANERSQSVATVLVYDVA